MAREMSCTFCDQLTSQTGTNKPIQFVANLRTAFDTLDDGLVFPFAPSMPRLRQLNIMRVGLHLLVYIRVHGLVLLCVPWF